MVERKPVGDTRAPVMAENMEAVDAINRGEPPADPTYIVQASLGSDNRPPPPPPAPAVEEVISVEDLSAPLS